MGEEAQRDHENVPVIAYDPRLEEQLRSDRADILLNRGAKLLIGRGWTGVSVVVLERVAEMVRKAALEQQKHPDAILKRAYPAWTIAPSEEIPGSIVIKITFGKETPDRAIEPMGSVLDTSFVRQGRVVFAFSRAATLKPSKVVEIVNNNAKQPYRKEIDYTVMEPRLEFRHVPF